MKWKRRKPELIFTYFKYVNNAAEKKLQKGFKEEANKESPLYHRVELKRTPPTYFSSTETQKE